MTDPCMIDAALARRTRDEAIEAAAPKARQILDNTILPAIERAYSLGESKLLIGPAVTQLEAVRVQIIRQLQAKGFTVEPPQETAEELAAWAVVTW